MLIVVAGEDANLTLAARNLPRVEVCTAAQIDPVSLLRCGSVLIAEDALKALDERMS